MSTKFLTTVFCLMFLIFSGSFAQEDSAVDKKINDIKSDVEKITISTKDGNITFEGKDAKDLFKRLKENKIKKRMKFITDNDEIIEFEGDHKIIKKLGDDDDMLIFISEDGDEEMLESKNIVKVNVEDENGEKKVTVTTINDGKKEIKVYEGKEAEKYLKEHETKDGFTFEFEGGGSAQKHIWVEKAGSRDDIKKKVKVDIKDGVKKITVTTVENGEEKTEKYEGKEADEYLEKMEKEGDGVKIIEKKMKDGKMKKKIIIKDVEEEDKDN